jgi:hypothetical protein
MARGKKRGKGVAGERAERIKVSAEVALKRMEDFPKRKEQFIASVWKGNDQGVLPDEPTAITSEYWEAKEGRLPTGGRS